uniref:Uncharacterized protein n=1 Tax=Avena sativa TaxID=4498 RepID=A0ACD5VWZ6_AVESA
MVEYVRNYHLLDKCMEDILFVIKPTEEDKKIRLGAIQEVVNFICLVGALRDAAVKPFGSFVSKLYAKSGDLDVSVELRNDSGFPTSRRRKIKALEELEEVLKYTGVARDVNFIPTARVPVLKYVSNRFGISCDISIDNYSGRIKSKVLYWISTMDERFGDMVLLVKEWAKAQNINDPKNGTLSSYTLCLLVISHFQYCKPAILPPMKEIFYASLEEGSGGFNENHLDQIWKENVAKFRRRDIGRRNHSSLSHLLATFFEKWSTRTGQLKRTQEMTKSSCRLVNDLFDRSDVDITVNAPGLQCIASAFERAKDTIYSCKHADRNVLLPLLCTPEVGSKLGVRATAGHHTNPAMSSQQHIHMGSTGSRPIGRLQGYISGAQASAPHWSQQRTDQQNSWSQASSGSTWQW